MKEQDIIKALKLHIFMVYETKSVYAEKKGVSEAYVSMVLNGKKHIPQSMLDDIGIQKKRVVSFKYSKIKSIE